MTEQNNDNSAKKPNRNRRRRPNNNRPKTANAAEQGQGQPQGQTNAPSKNKNRNRKKYNKPLTPDRILSKYDNLLDQHLVARRKFFELNGRANNKLVLKAKTHFYRSVEDLRRYESSLKDWQKETLLKKTEFYPMENSYTEKHELPEHTYENVLSILADGDPHLLTKQKDADYSRDVEETSGSMEEYEAYKSQ